MINDNAMVVYVYEKAGLSIYLHMIEIMKVNIGTKLRKLRELRE